MQSILYGLPHSQKEHVHQHSAGVNLIDKTFRENMLAIATKPEPLCSQYFLFEMAPSVSVNFMSLVTSYVRLLGEEPQTAFLMSFIHGRLI